jgi:hypothetical protein
LLDIKVKHAVRITRMQQWLGKDPKRVSGR